MSKILIPRDAPDWLFNVIGEIEQTFVRVAPRIPVKLPSYDSSLPAGLPSAVKYPGTAIWITNLNTIAVSDGTHWFPVTLGAHL